MLEKHRPLIVANVVLFVAMILYTLSPIDLLPDFIPFLGWVDDLLAIAVTLAFTGYTISTIVADAPEPKRLPATGAYGIAGYEPLSAEQIEAL